LSGESSESNGAEAEAEKTWGKMRELSVHI